MSLVFYLLLNCNPLFSQGVMVLSEGDLPRLVKSSAVMTSEKYEIKARAEKTGYLNRSFIPEAEVFAAQEHFEYASSDFQTQPTYGGQVTFNLFRGGVDYLQEEINEASLDQARAHKKVVYSKQLERARKAYWQIVYLQELIGEFSKVETLIEKNRMAAQRRIKAGVATRSDKYEFDVKLVEVLQDRKRAELNLLKLKGYLKVLTGLEQAQSIKISQSLDHDHSWRVMLAHSEAEHSYLLEPQKFKVLKTQLQSDMASRSWLPEVNAYAIWKQQNQRQDFERLSQMDRQMTVFGVSLSWQFLDFIHSNVEKEALLAEKQSEYFKLKYKEAQLSNELHLELEELEILDELVHKARLNTKTSQNFLRMVKEEYGRGVKSSNDMLAATEKVFGTKVRLMTIIRDFHLARAHVMTKLGK